MLSHDEVIDRPHARPRPARRGGTRAPPAPRRHERRGRPRRRPAPGDRALGRGAHRLERADAAQPGRRGPPAAGLGRSGRARPRHARRDTGGRLARHPRPRRAPRRRLVQRPSGARRRPGRRPPRAAVARRPGGAAQRAAGAARRHRRPAPPAHHAAQRRRLPLHRSSTCTSRSPCRGTPPRSSTPPAATCGSARRSGTPSAYGTYLRESRRGRPGADATLLLAAGRPGFGFERGRVHAVHVAWSGNHRLVAERSVSGEAFLAGGELFAPGEVVLAPGCVAHVAGGRRVLGRRAQRARPPLPRRVAQPPGPPSPAAARSPSTRGRPSTSTTPSTG